MAIYKCRHTSCIPKFQTTEFDELKVHWLLEHSQDYITIQRWLRDSFDEKLLLAEKIAKEGMLGHRDGPKPPHATPMPRAIVDCDTDIDDPGNSYKKGGK